MIRFMAVAIRIGTPAHDGGNGRERLRGSTCPGSLLQPSALPALHLVRRRRAASAGLCRVGALG